MFSNKYGFDINDLYNSFNINNSKFSEAVYRVIMVSRFHAGLSTHKIERNYQLQDKNEAFANIIQFTNANQYSYQMLYDDEIVISKKAKLRSVIELVIYVNTSENSLEFIAYGDLNSIEKFYLWTDQVFAISGTEFHVAASMSSPGHGMAIKMNTSYLEATPDNTAKASFYPWLKTPLEEYFESYMKAKESVLVLYGPPGTGKSTFLRSLITSGKYKSLTSYDKDIIQSPVLLSVFMGNYDYRILCYEDADGYIGSREDGNTLMTSILNAADGIAGQKGRKLIFSTNLNDIKKIDPALLRVGRCHDILPFKKLTAKQAAIVREDTGKPVKDFSSQEEWSLAEVLNDKSDTQQTVNRFSKRDALGF